MKKNGMKFLWIGILAVIVLTSLMSGCKERHPSLDENGTDSLPVSSGISDPADSEVPRETTTGTETDGESSTEDIRNTPKPGPFDLTSDVVLPPFEGLHVGTSEKPMRLTFTGFDDSERSFSTYWGTPTYRDGTLYLTSGQVTDTIFPVQNDGSGKTVYRMTVQSDTPASYANWETLFIGLRLGHARYDATGKSGIWVALRGREIGLRTGEWPETTYMACPLSFDESRTLIIVDDAKAGCLSVSGLNDAGDEVPICVIRINGKQVSMLAPGQDVPEITDTLRDPVPSSGYTSLWAHIPKNAVELRDISMEVTVKSVDTEERCVGGRPLSRDVWPDTWVACDDLFRMTADSGKAPNDRKVGIFYFLWHEQTRQPIYDHNRSYLEGGKDALCRTLTEGPLGFAHYWAEPYFGYYCSNDEWVLRKHASQLTEAGVDFVYLDATNGYLYEQNLNALLRVWGQMRTEGLATPDVCFLTKYTDQAEFNALWDNYYATGQYFDLWFRFNGKPLILFAVNSSSDPIVLTDEQKDFFTIRYSWAMTSGQDWYQERKGIDCWPWAESYPQNFGFALDENGHRIREQMNVLCGFWANGTFGIPGGRSYTKKQGIPSVDRPWDFGYGLMDTTTGAGLAFQEGFDRAIEKCPPVLMVTGFNEWWAGRFEGRPAVGQKIGGEYIVSANPKDWEHNYYVDNLTPEYSRDIEAMKGGFRDNYYYQLAKNVRAYKGARPVEAAFGQWAVDIEGSHGQWFTVGPEYRDPAFDTAHRHHPSAVGELTYTNDTGRNDIVTAKVSNDEHFWYFYVECREDLIRDEGRDWMNLFIKSDGDEKTGFYGYDYILNRSRDGKTVSVEHFTATDGTNGWDMETVGSARYTVSGRVMQIQVEKSLLNLGATFDFKWADHSVIDGDIMQFTDRGDAAPDGRFAYRFTTEEAGKWPVPEALPDGAVVLKVNSYSVCANGQIGHLVKDHTKAVTLASGRDVWLPVSFLESVLHLSVTGERLNHYGVEYVKATEQIESSGKVLTFTPEGLIVIADREITDTSLLTVLYRNLY